MFREAAIYGGSITPDEYTMPVTVYISKCSEDVIVSILTHPNQKPWVTAEVYAHDTAFRSVQRKLCFESTNGMLLLQTRFLVACSEDVQPPPSPLAKEIISTVL